MNKKFLAITTSVLLITNVGTLVYFLFYSNKKDEVKEEPRIEIEIPIVTEKDDDANILFKKGRELDDEGKFKEAIIFFKQAAERHHIKAKYMLGKYYLFGLGVTTNEVKGIEYLDIAFKEGYVDAIKLKGYYYLSKFDEYINYDSWAFEAYKQAAQCGDPEAQCLVGKFYLTGFGTMRNRKEAANWFLKSANQGYGNAYTFLGRCFNHSLGVKEDKDKAKICYERACKRNCVDAEYQMSMFLFARNDVSENVLKYREEAIKNGHPGYPEYEQIIQGIFF